MYKPATAENGRAEVMFLRHYSHGTLQKETVLRVAEQDLRRQELKDKPKMRRAEKHAAVQVRLGSGFWERGVCRPLGPRSASRQDLRHQELKDKPKRQ